MIREAEMIKYVIFDMDGTLLDTEPLYEQSWLETGVKYGVPDVGKIYASHICGRTIESAKTTLKEFYGEAFDSESFVSDRMARYYELTRAELKLKNGCLEVLDFLSSQCIPCAIATSTITELTYDNLNRVGIFDRFNAIVTSSMVEHGKPAPDIFIEAGKRIGAAFEQCIVCEDSYSGIEAAHNAGMVPIFIPDRLPSNEKTNRLSYETLSSLFDVIEFIKKENKLI